MISVHRKFLNANIACATRFTNSEFLTDGTGVSGTCQDFCTSEGALFPLRKVRKENAFRQNPQSSILRASFQIYWDLVRNLILSSLCYQKLNVTFSLSAMHNLLSHRKTWKSPVTPFKRFSMTGRDEEEYYDDYYYDDEIDRDDKDGSARSQSKVGYVKF